MDKLAFLVSPGKVKDWHKDPSFKYEEVPLDVCSKYFKDVYGLNDGDLINMKDGLVVLKSGIQKIHSEIKKSWRKFFEEFDFKLKVDKLISYLENGKFDSVPNDALYILDLTLDLSYCIVDKAFTIITPGEFSRLVGTDILTYLVNMGDKLVINKAYTESNLY